MRFRKSSITVHLAVLARAGEALAELDRVLDRSRLMPSTAPTPAVLDAKDDLKYNHGLEH